MRKSIYTLIACLALAAGMMAQTPSLQIQVNRPTAKVNPGFYGLMTEEINYSYDGGIYAELVRDRTPGKDWEALAHWTQVVKGKSLVAISVDDKTGPSEALQRSLKMVVTGANAAAPAGMQNDGYWGMAVRPNTEYTGSFWAKTDGAGTPITVALVNDQTGATAASATVTGVTGEWKQYSFKLKTGVVAVSANNHLQLTVAAPATVWFDLVSLFPPTYHNRPYGSRTDLMEKMAALHPTFLRLPGGNYLEGDHVADRFDWKKTIGPLTDRPTHMSPWRYRSSDGMGLLEFLNWCEDLKMEPLLAVYAGYSLAQDHVDPGPALEPFVQDALDEIEYVSGSADTKWGAVRASNGHPAPFPLHYVEIGNEDVFDKSASYDGRFAQFYKAIKAKYPELQLIATTPVKGTRPDVVDEHYYMSAEKSFADATHYDKYDRNGPKIFVGEWATREGSPTPNMASALGDAAWMTGMERNSDIVIKEAYAPMLVNVNPGGMQWASDLIGYDALTSYGSPSYWVQVMFASHMGTEIVDSKLEGGGPRVFAGISRNEQLHKLYVKVVNGSSETQKVAIALDGIKSVKPDALLVTLSAKSPNATNTIEHPNAIKPVDTHVKVDGLKFAQSFEPYSVNVLELSY